MIQRMLTSALFAGCAAGLLAALLHFAFVQKFILLGEQYETGELVHFDTASPPATAAHDNDAATEPAPADGTAPAAAEPAEGQDDAAVAHPAGEPASVLQRNALTVLFTMLAYVSYALILVAGFGLAENFGHQIAAREGLLWGLAGFASFQMAPALGLAPELPGTIAAEIGARQIWWWGTALASGTGLALLAYGRGILPWVIAGALLAAPHVIGAPEVEVFQGVAPPEVAAAFSARVLGVGLVVWSVLGWLAGRFWEEKAT